MQPRVLRISLRKFFGIAALALTAALTLTLGLLPAEAEEDPDFCAQARWESQLCVTEFQNCGGFFTPGCWEAFDACWVASGIHFCE